MDPDGAVMLELDDVRFGFENRPDFLGPISAVVRRGDCWAIVGPNGAGKSTLLRIMAGLLAPQSGSVSLEGNPLGSLTGRGRAKRIAFVAQSTGGELDFSARDVVMMGRFPHRSFGLFESAGDGRFADRTMTITDTAEFADRPMKTLSGGEAQRVHLAAALAQDPSVLLLDEPTASLDLHHQLAIFEILRDRADRDGLAVVVVTHDVNLAVRFCSRVLLLHEGGAVAQGTPDEVLTPKQLAPVYGVEMVTLMHPDDPARRWIVPLERTSEAPR
ncbi:MAG: ABC transporter ATP-binding protein [Planctomycetes bacterium]|nr:ABC transporter ATP-binding protein [Planctomycetota bacterium]